MPTRFLLLMLEPPSFAKHPVDGGAPLRGCSAKNIVQRDKQKSGMRGHAC